MLGEQGIPHKTIRRHDHLFNINTSSAFELGIPFSLFDRAEAAVKEAYGDDEAMEPDSRLLPMDSGHMPGARFGPGAFGPWGEPVEESLQGFTLPSIIEPSADPHEPENLRVRDADRNSGEDDAGGATTEIWSGDEQEMAEFIAASLQTNQIQTRHDRSGGKHTLYVRPEDEVSAIEIVREVIEGVPPD